MHTITRSYRYMLLLVLTFCVMTMVNINSASSAPEPSLVQSRWQFDFTHKAPRLITVQVPGKKAPQSYWYIQYTVTNNTGREGMWVPSIAIYTNRGALIQADKNVPEVAYKAIKNATKNSLLQSPIDAVGKLRQGNDQAVDSMIVWPAGNKDVDQIQVFTGGLSGETLSIKIPKTNQRILLKKTLMLTFDMPGTPKLLTKKPVKKVGESWVMR